MNSDGLVLWNACVICEMSKTSCKTGKHLVRGVSENHLKGPIIPFGAMVEYRPISTRDSTRLH